MEVPSVQYVKTSDGIDIAYTVKGDGLPLIVLPIQFNHVQLAWQGVNSGGVSEWHVALSARHRLVTYDARCQGLSTRGCPASDWLEGDLADLGAVVNTLKLNRFVLFGVVGRTHTAIHYAVRNPERVHALILQGPLIKGATGLNVHGATLAERDWEFFLRSQIPVGASQEASERIMTYLRAAMHQDDWLACIETFAVSDVGDVLEKVKVPTLVTCPTSSYTSEADAREVAARIPGARLLMQNPYSGFPGGTVGATPTDAVAAIESFLGELGAPEEKSEGNLSPREIEVLALVSEGKTNREIAEALTISERTVINHLSNIFAKTGAENRAGAAAYALRHGLV